MTTTGSTRFTTYHATEPVMFPEVLPAAVRDIELTGVLPTIPAMTGDGRRVDQAWVLFRWFSEPLGAALVDVPLAGQGDDGVSFAAQSPKKIKWPRVGPSFWAIRRDACTASRKLALAPSALSAGRGNSANEWWSVPWLRK